MIRAAIGALLLMAVALPSRAEPLMLTLVQAEEVFGALGALGAGHDVLIREGERHRLVKQPFKGWGVPVIIAMTKNINALKPSIVAYEEARVRRIRDITDEDGKIPLDAQRNVVKELEAQRAEAQSYDLVKIKVSDLKLETNPISPSILSALAPILVIDEN